MSFLAPLYLLLAGAIAVPLILHLMRRRIGVARRFPAARYLARAEKEHSRTLRIQKSLIDVAPRARAARHCGRGGAPGGALGRLGPCPHRARDRDRQFVQLFGRHQRTSAARPVQVDGARRRVGDVDRPALARHDRRAGARRIGQPSRGTSSSRLEPIAGAGDPAAALSRASRGGARRCGSDARQVALVTDGQRSEWQRVPPIPNVQLVLYVPTIAPSPNHAVALADARPVRWTPRGAVAARFLSRDSTTYRITLSGRTFARGTAAPNEEVVVRASPPERGWVAGTVELEPDELPGDNVRHFAMWIGPAPGVSDLTVERDRS